MVNQTLLGRIAIAIDSRVEGFVRGITRAERATKKNQRELARLRREARQATQAYRNLAQNMTNFGQIAGAAFASIGIAQIGRDFLDFDREVTKITTLVGISAEKTAEFRRQILALSKEVGTPALGLAEGLFFLTSAGLRGELAIRALTASAKAGAVGLGSVKDITDAVTSAMGAYGAEVLGAEEATDTLLATVRKGRLDAAELAGGLVKVLAPAAQAGILFAEVGGVLAALTTTGYNTQDALTGMRQVISKINVPTKIMQAGLAQVNLTVEEFRNFFRDHGLFRGMEMFRDHLADYGKEVVAIFRQTEGAAVINQMLANIDNFDNAITEVTESAGAVDTALRQAFDTPSFRVQIAINAVKTGLLELAHVVIPPLVDNFQTLISFLATMAARAYVIAPTIALWNLYAARTGSTLTAIGGVLATILRRLAVIVVTMQTIGAIIDFFQATNEAEAGSLETLEALGSRLAIFAAEAVGAVRDYRGEIDALESDIEKNTRLIARAREGFGNTVLGDRLVDEYERENRQLERQLYLVRQAQAAAEGNLSPTRQILVGVGVDEDGTTEAGRKAADLFEREVTERVGNLLTLLGFREEDLDTSLFAELGDTYAAEIVKAITEAQEEASNVLSGGAVPLAARNFGENLARGLAAEARKAELDLSLIGLSNAERERATALLRVEEQVGNKIVSVQRQREGIETRLAKAREKNVAEQIVSLEKQLSSAIAYENSLKRILEVGTEENDRVRELIDRTVTANAEAERRNEILSKTEDIQGQIAVINEQNASLSGGVLQHARDELEVARLRLRLANRFTGEDETEIQVRIFSERRRLERELENNLSRRAELEAELRDASLSGNAAAAQAARDEIALNNERRLALEQVRDDLNLTAATYRKTNSAVEELENGIHGTLQTLRAEIGRTVENVVVQTASLQDGIRGIVDVIVSEFLRLALIRPILNYIFGDLSGGLGGLASAAPQIGSGPHFAQGGFARGFAVVGERGPELIDFRTPARVYPNEDLAAAVGGGGNTVNFAFNVNSTDGPGVRRALEQARPVFQQDAIKAVEYLSSDRTSGISRAVRRR